MDNFNFNLFKYFYYVAIYGGVTNAAKNLSVAQPSLSLSVKNLENQLGKTLINRNNKQFALTEDGNQLFQTIKPLFENIEKNVDFFQDEKKYLKINIGIRYSYGLSILSEFIKLFRYEFPKVKIIVDLYSKLNFDKLKNNEYDIVIDDYEYTKQIEDAKTEVLCELDNYFICGSSLIDEYRNVKSVKELDNAELISYRPSLKTGKFKQYCYENVLNFIDIVNVNESDLYFKLIKDNYGIGFSNELLIKEYVNDKTIYIIGVEEELFKDKLSVAYINNNKVIEDFIKMLKKYIKEEMK